MKSAVCGLSLVLVLLFCLFVGLFVGCAGANPTFNTAYITIRSDGIVNPETDLIVREGNVYSLTANLTSAAVKILCDDVVFDGRGYWVVGGNEDVKGWYGNAGLLLENVSNVAIKNVTVFGYAQGITLENCQKCVISGIDTIYFMVRNSSYNTIAGNNIADDSPFYLLNSTDNRIYMNNLTCFVGVVGANFWDNGMVGNYWGNYFEKYPNALEVSNTGIIDTPYVIDPYCGTVFEGDNVDRYPLMEPCHFDDASSMLSVGVGAAGFSFSAILVAGICGFSAVVVALTVLLLSKKKGELSKSD